MPLVFCLKSGYWTKLAMPKSRNMRSELPFLNLFLGCDLKKYELKNNLLGRFLIIKT